jgi:hypothetical protein
MSPAPGCSAAANHAPSPAGSLATSKKASRGSPSDRAAGASPLFPPAHAQPASAQTALLDVVRREPRQFGIRRSRWRLVDLLATCDWLQLTHPSSLWRLLDRLDISYCRGRAHVHSPDPDYEAKRAHLEALRAQVQAAGPRQVLVFQDEFSYYRQATVAADWAARGGPAPCAEQGYGANTRTRVAATLGAADGQVCYVQGSRCGIPQLRQLYQQLVQAYPQAERIYVVQDNWPVHFHPDLLVALIPQQPQWPFKVPAQWPTEASATARRRWGHLQLPLELVMLPSYASWLNPIEKLWRWARQDVLHLHRCAEALEELRGHLQVFFEQFTHGSPELLRYVGLAP